jgi:hypothetical protein
MAIMVCQISLGKCRKNIAQGRQPISVTAQGIHTPGLLEYKHCWFSVSVLLLLLLLVLACDLERHQRDIQHQIARHWVVVVSS